MLAAGLGSRHVVTSGFSSQGIEPANLVFVFTVASASNDVLCRANKPKEGMPCKLVRPGALVEQA